MKNHELDLISVKFCKKAMKLYWDHFFAAGRRNTRDQERSPPDNPSDHQECGQPRNPPCDQDWGPPRNAIVYQAWVQPTNTTIYQESFAPPPLPVEHIIQPPPVG